MKAIVAVLLLSAFAAYVSGEEQALHKAVYQFLDERHDEKMAQVLRDQGLPEDTLVASDHPEPPEWMKPCVARGKVCWRRAGHNPCKKLACIEKFEDCLKDNLPTNLPSLAPGQKLIVKGCAALLKLCKKHSPSCAGELCCYVRIHRCFALVFE